MSRDSDYAEKLIARYHVPDSIGSDKPAPTRWPLSDYRDEAEVLRFANNELKCQRNDLLADIHKAETSAARYRRYFLWCSGALGVLVAAGIGWQIWRWLWRA